jgi:hypothetical protein
VSNDLENVGETLVSQADNPSVETMLAHLSRIGRPSIMMTGNFRWHARVHLSVPPPGMSAEIESHFGHQTPRSALLLLWRRTAYLRANAG